METATLPTMRAGPPNTMQTGGVAGGTLAQAAVAKHPVERVQQMRYEGQQQAAHLRSVAAQYGLSFAQHLHREGIVAASYSADCRLGGSLRVPGALGAKGGSGAGTVAVTAAGAAGGFVPGTMTAQAPVAPRTLLGNDEEMSLEDVVGGGGQFGGESLGGAADGEGMNCSFATGGAGGMWMDREAALRSLA